MQAISETKREAVATLRLTSEEKDRFREAARRSGHLELASWLRGLAMIEADRVLGNVLGKESEASFEGGIQH